MNHKTVLVTGATKGIGLAISNLSSQSGYQVIGIARSQPSQEFPGKLFQCDLGNLTETEEILQEIKRTTPNINHIVNNVGVALPQALGNIDLTSLHTVLDLNIRSAVQVTQTFLEYMKTTKYGRIINVASLAASFGVPNRSSYSAAKSALLSLTRTWAVELATYGITVNSISPGPTETELFRKARPVGSKEEQDVLARIPLGRIGKPEETAATVKFILSEEASFITGQNICVDGGASIL